MTGTSPDAGSRSSPPHAERIQRRVQAGLDEAPIVHLWGWPGTGGSALVEALAVDGARPAHLLRQATDGRLHPGGDLPVDDLPVGDLWTAVDDLAQLDGEALRRWIDRGGRLVVSCPRRPPPTASSAEGSWTDLDVHRVLPTELLLSRNELAAWAPSPSVEALDRLWRVTEGWWRPCELLASTRRIDFDSADVEPLHGWFRRHFLPKLDAEERSVLSSLVESVSSEQDAVADLDLDLDTWRLAQVDRPESLAALERLRHVWGLLPGGRLPSLLARLPREVWGPVGAIESRLEQARILITETKSSSTTSVPDVESRSPSASVSTSSVSTSSVSVPGEPEARVAAERVRFEVRLLGEPQVVRVDGEGSTLLRWRLRRALGAVLFLALAEGRQARKEALVEALWAEADVGAVQRNFHPTLSEARRTLGAGRAETLRCQRSIYSLGSGVEWWVDTDRFEEAVEAGHNHRRRGAPEAALASWRGAWKLYRGPLLAADESPWVAAPRLRFQELYLGMLRGIGELASGHDEPTLAIDAYRSLLIEEAYEEPVHRALMELYARRGRRDLVRRQFVRLQELLLDDLGIEPSVETQERYHELMR